jgi:threonine dehydrogenase-like Zn-dependent dehydrogenase
MKAAVLLDAHSMVIDDVPVPVPGEGEVLLKVHSCGICGTDMEFYENGAYNPRWTLGHECSAIIEKVGQGVNGWKPGDRVVVNDLFSCGSCDFCRRGLESLCANAANLGIHWPGAFAEYTKAPVRSLFRLPQNIRMEQGALIPTLAVGYHVTKQAHLSPDMKTLIVGAGPIGLSVLLALKIAGVRKVAVSDVNEMSRKVARRLGASAAVDPSTEDLSERMESFFGSPPRLVIECVGKPGTILQSMEVVERGGTVIIVGNCFEEIVLHPITWILKEIKIHASQGTASDDFSTTIGWMSKGKVDAASFITRTISLDDLPRVAQELTVSKRDIKIIVTI